MITRLSLSIATIGCFLFLSGDVSSDALSRLLLLVNLGMLCELMRVLKEKSD